MKKLGNSFKYAFCGIVSSFKTEANMKIHISIMLLVIIMGLVLKITVVEWFICLIWFALVIAGELFNTAMEIAIDLAMPKKNQQAKLAKDISAGAVLVLAISSAITGLLIFIPKIITLLKFYN